jgi:xylulokinase
MTGPDLVVGVDLGTSGVKAGVFDVEGRELARACVRHPTRAPGPDWAEQAPEDWWDACCRAAGEVSGRVDAARIRGACVVGLSPALVCLDLAGKPVRPAPIWCDRRAAREAEELVERLGPAAAFGPLSQLLWLKRHEPRAYAATRCVLESFEYLALALTGEAVAIPPFGPGRSASDADVAAVGLDPGLFPDRACALGATIGPLTPAAARATGLPCGVPVVAGTIDSFAAWLGTATLDPGVACNTAGTTDGLAVVTSAPVADPRGRVHAVPHVVGGRWIAGGAMSSGGCTLDWFVRRFYDGVEGPYAAAERDAGSVPPGAGGLVVLPYVAGERAPINDPDARCVFFGIGAEHTRAHLARAVLESVAFAVRDVCEPLAELGASIDEVRVAGGGARSLVWSQIRADVLGRPVRVPEVPDSSLLGAAATAAAGAGLSPDLAAASRAMVSFRTLVEPDPERKAHYDELFELYRAIYAHMREDFARLAVLRGAGRVTAAPPP